jgi:PBP1b-binding outer membrane lipoprotein LpoB
MKKILSIFVCVLVMSGCSTPQPPQPSGDWTPVNAPLTNKG